MTIAAVVLAAGKGTRMKSDRAKVLHEAAGRSLLGWSLAALAPLDLDHTVVVVGHDAQSVADACPDDVTPVLQEPQNGTGHAVQVALEALDEVPDTVIVLPADMPLLESSRLGALLQAHTEAGASASILTVVLDDPEGYGRIVRDGDSVVGIVEHRDATEAQREIREVNTLVNVFAGADLVDALSRLTNDNDQREYYLPDVVGIFAADGRQIMALATDPVEGLGVNSQGQLAEVSAIIRSRINEQLLADGVWMLDPGRVYVDAGVSVEPGARLFPDIYLRGSTSVGANAVVGPSVDLVDTTVGSEATVRNAVAISASIGQGAAVGPFAYLRPGAVLGPGAKVGTYVEVKGSTIGDGSKVPHLSYIGDATIGSGTNIGAGTITVNYDGYEKHRTVIGDNVRIGSDTMLVAPVEVGDDAFTGAGSVITDDVPDGALAVERTTQKNVDGYADRRRRRAEGDAD